MASLEESLVAILSGHAGLTALISDRISPSPLPEGSTLPAITYQLISRVAQHTQDEEPGLFASRMQVDVWGATALSALETAQQVYDALERYKGTVNGVRIDAMLSDDERALVEPVTQSHRRVIDFMIWSNA